MKIWTIPLWMPVEGLDLAVRKGAVYSVGVRPVRVRNDKKRGRMVSVYFWSTQRENLTALFEEYVGDQGFPEPREVALSEDDFTDDDGVLGDGGSTH